MRCLLNLHYPVTCERMLSLLLNKQSSTEDLKKLLKNIQVQVMKIILKYKTNCKRTSSRRDLKMKIQEQIRQHQSLLVFPLSLMALVALDHLQDLKQVAILTRRRRSNYVPVSVKKLSGMEEGLHLDH